MVSERVASARAAVRLCRTLGVCAALAVLAACGDAPVPEVLAPTCDRDCLLGIVDLYFTALAARDPARAPFAPAARFTENAQVLELGDGLWATASDRAESYELAAADAAAGQAAFYVRMEENGSPIWLAGRLRVQNFAITELETVVVRRGVGFGNFERSHHDSVWDEVLAPDQRRPRAKMIAIADRYFTAIQDNLAGSVPFDDVCVRFDNGVQTANDPAAVPPDGAPNVAALSCRENLDSPIWAYVSEIAPRRYLGVDEDRGIVFGMFMFHHDGSIASVDVPGFGRYEYTGAARRPFTTVVSAMFKIADGNIRRIEGVLTALPYGSRSRWDE